MMRAIADAGVLAAVTVVATWPLAIRLGTVLPGQLFAFDQYLVVALLEWTRRVVLSSPDRLFDVPLCYPASGVLATTEHFLGLLPIYGPLRWVMADPLAAYQVVLLAVFVACGVTMALVVRRWTGDELAALVAGCLYALSPLRIASMAWIHVLATFCFPLLLLALERVLSDGRGRATGLLVVVAIVQVSLGVYATVFAVVLCGLYAAGFFVGLGRRRSWRGVLRLGAAALLVAPVALAFAAPYLRHPPMAAGELGLGQLIGRQSTGLFLLDPLDGMAAIGTRALRLLGLRRTLPLGGGVPVAVDAGVVALVLAVVGLWRMPAAGPIARARAVGLGVLLCVGILLALGPGFVPILGYEVPLPGMWLTLLPVTSGLRTPERYLLVAAPAIAAAAGVGFSQLLRGRSTTARAAAAGAVIALALWEAGPPAMTPVRLLSPPSTVDRYLRKHGGDLPVLEWPLLAPLEVLSRGTIETVWRGTPSTRCFTSIYPPPWLALAIEAVSVHAPAEFAALVERYGIGWVLADPRSPLSEAWLSAAGMRLVLEDPDRQLFARPGGRDLRSQFAGGTMTVDGHARTPLAAAARQAELRLLPIPAPVAGAPVAVVAEVTNPTTDWWPGGTMRGARLVQIEAAWQTDDGRPVSTASPAVRERLERVPGLWREALRERYTVADGQEPLGRDLAPGATRTLRFELPGVPAAGRYRLRFRVVQVGVAAFTLSGDGTDELTVPVAVRPWQGASVGEYTPGLCTHAGCPASS